MPFPCRKVRGDLDARGHRVTVSGMERGAATVVAAVVLALAVAAAPASADPNPAKAIIVYNGDTNINVLAKFKRVNCKVTRNGGQRKFKAKGKSRGWELDIRANDFNGYHEYPIAYGIRKTNFIIRPPGNNGFFSNFFFPGDQPPPFGGELNLISRKRIALGFISAFSSRSDDDAVGVVGHAKCD